jgi:hypothetical protein
MNINQETEYFRISSTALYVLKRMIDIICFANTIGYGENE